MAGEWDRPWRKEKRRFVFIFTAGNALMAGTAQRDAVPKRRTTQDMDLTEFISQWQSV